MPKKGPPKRTVGDVRLPLVWSVLLVGMWFREPRQTEIGGRVLIHLQWKSKRCLRSGSARPPVASWKGGLKEKRGGHSWVGKMEGGVWVTAN